MYTVVIQVKQSSLEMKNLSLDQLCPTRGPVEGFVWPSLGFGCSKSILQMTTYLSMPLYHVCYHCSYDSNTFSPLA